MYGFFFQHISVRFLPLTLAGYYPIDRRFKNLFLLIASPLFYVWGEPKFVFVMICSILVNKEYVMRKLTGNYLVIEFWADKDITCSLEQGDMHGIIGTNGAGK